MQMFPPVLLALPASAARRTLGVRLTRDGERTAGTKFALLLDERLALLAVFATDHEAAQTFLASAIDGPRLLLAIDPAEPRRAAARYPAIAEDTTLVVDLNDGSGGGAAGQPATLAARVRVDGLDAAREVLAVERQSDGAWRIAGSLRTAEGALDLRVTGGEVYALAIDDWGLPFQPGLAVEVGQTVRPSRYAGWLYRISEAGTLPDTEPDWWDDRLSTPQPLGSARAVAVRYHRPLAHGPVPVAPA